MSARISVHGLTIALALLAGALRPQTVEAGDVASGDLAVVVSARNPLDSLSQAELTAIFLGRATHFPNGRPAVPVDQRQGAAREAFYAAYLGRTPAQMKSHWSKILFTGRGSPPREVAGSAEVRALVARDPTAIGYLERQLAGPDVKILRIE